MKAATENIPKGYKQTEVGVIPEAWVVKQLGELFEITSSKRVFQSEWKTEGVPFYRARELAVLAEKGYVKNELFISKEMYRVFKNTYGVPQIGDILVTGVGTLGKVYVVPSKDEFYFKDGNIIWFKTEAKVNSEFLSQLYLTRLIIKQIEDASAGTTVGTYTISGAKKTTIPFPPLVEQSSIAAILSDTDELIEGMEKLIAKKHAIKQGAMQELLTGKRRLPGFSGEWEVKKLGEVASVIGGGTPSSYNPKYWNGMINWFTPTEIGLNKYTYGSIRKITKEGLENSSARMLPKGAILLTTRAGIGDLSILMNEGCTNQGFQSLVANIDVNNEYLYYLLSTLKNILIQNSSGSTFLEISPKRIKQIEVKMPSLKEQIAIARVIADMDSEINALEQKLSKYKMIKIGMMQNLLTGKIRVYGTHN